MDFGTCEGIEEDNVRCLVKDYEPTMRGAAVALAVVGGFWKVEEVDSVGGEIEEGLPRLVGLRLWKHEPRELGREPAWRFWYGESKTATRGLEAEVIAVDCDLIGDGLYQFWGQFGPIYSDYLHLRLRRFSKFGYNSAMQQQSIETGKKVQD